MFCCKPVTRQLELWNVELSECIRSWTDLEYITKVIPISEERVACEVQRASQVESALEARSAREGESKVIIVDTTRKGNVSTITLHGYFVGCNSKCQVISATHGQLQMKCGDKVLWKVSHPYFGSFECGIFSPTEQYYLFSGSKFFSFNLYVVDVVSGKALCTLQPRPRDVPFLGKLYCKFVSDEECITCFRGRLNRNFLQLFNVKSADLLSQIAMEWRVYSLATCPRERLVAIGFEDSKLKFKVLRVNLPGDEDSRKSKRSGFINKKQGYYTIIQPSLLRDFNQSQYDFAS